LKQTIFIFLVVGFLNTSSQTAEKVPQHPFLLFTRADIAALKESVEKNKETADMAKEFVYRASKERIENLPKFEANWWKNPIGKEEYYTVINKQTIHIPQEWSTTARDCAYASIFDPNLAAKAKTCLLTLSKYEFAPMPYAEALNYARFGEEALEAYDFIYDQFSDAEHKQMDDFFNRLLNAVKEDDARWAKDYPDMPVNNHYAWHKLTFCMHGLFYGKPELVEFALHGPNGVDLMMKHGFRDDGLWLEASLAYAYTQLNGMLLMAEMLKNCNYPTGIYNDTADGRNIKQGYDAILNTMFPDGYIPEIGDVYGWRPAPETLGYEILYKRFGDPKYAWLIRSAGKRSYEALFRGSPDLPLSSNPPPQYSRLWPEQGYAALRSVEGVDYWSGRGWSLFATYSNAAIHRHLDRLSIMLFGNGHLWLPDSEAHSVNNWGSVGELNHHTLAHNTVLVNGEQQRDIDRRLDLIEYNILPGAKRLTIGDLSSLLYPGVRQMRTCIIRDQYVVDFFQVQSTQPQEFDWVTHIDGEPNACSENQWQSVQLPQDSGWKYLRNAQTAAASSSSIWESFSYKQSYFRMDIVTDGPAEFIKCDFPLDKENSSRGTRPMRIIRCKKNSAWFAAIYRCDASAYLPIKLDVSPGELDSLKLVVKLGDQRFEHRIPVLK
jgi:hypothetical protein